MEERDSSDMIAGGPVNLGICYSTRIWVELNSTLTKTNL